MDPTRAEFWIAVAVACLCGALIGVERQLRGKPAGIRTSMLICLGTMVFVGLGREVVGPSGDITRVLSQVTTGVGFIGAGVMLAREGLVKGVTSASVIWILAAIGALAGFGRHLAAMLIAVIVLVVLSGVQYLEDVIVHLSPDEYKKHPTGEDPDEG